MKEFGKYFNGLERDYGFCNVENGYIEPESGKLKFDPGDYGWSKRAITQADYDAHLNGNKAKVYDDDNIDNRKFLEKVEDMSQASAKDSVIEWGDFYG